PVLPLPPERATPRHLQPGEVDTAAAQQIEMLLGEVLAHRSDEPDAGEEARRVREVCGRAAQRLAYRAERRCDALARRRARAEQLSHGGAPCAQVGSTCR